MSKIKAEIKKQDYYYECGDGCCSWHATIYEVNGEVVFLDHLCVRCADFLTDFELGETNICLMCEAELEEEWGF